MESLNQTFISVVTPFYNTEQYLEECIKSVLSQSYRNFEYILVNNCSTDGSLKIASEYAEKDKRIRLINNNSFLTQAQNYNHALRQISPESEYCKIVEADNWIFPDCLNQMVKVAKDHPSVGLVGAYHLEGASIQLDGLPFPSTFLTGKLAGKLHLLSHPEKWFLGPATSHLYRSDFIRQKTAFFDEKSLFEDIESYYEILSTTDFGFVHQVLSFIRVDNENESITASIKDFKPWILHSLIALKKYGPIFLNEDEYKSRFKEIEGRYLRMLGESLLRCRGKDFWDYHKLGLKAIGYQLNRLTLLRYSFLVLMDFILNPKSTVEKIYNRFLDKPKSKKVLFNNKVCP